jgi:rRNA-processing protein FCF1
MTLVSERKTCQDRVEYELGSLRFIVPSSVLMELEAIMKKGAPKRSKIAERAIQIAIEFRN